MNKKSFIFLLVFVSILGFTNYYCEAQDAGFSEPTVDEDLGASREALRTDAEVIKRDEERIRLDGLSPAQMKELHQKAQNYTFQAEVNRMMKLIINSLYRNKDIFLRELISNASDALDKIRLLSLTQPSVIDANLDMSIRIKVDKDNKMLHIIDGGIGMTKNDLIKNLGTIAKSGTAEFLNKMNDENSTGQKDLNDMIGQFGVGFYSSFLVADKVIVTSKHNDEESQYIWESDANSFSIVEDPRGNVLKRGTQVSLQLKEEASDYTDDTTLKNLVTKYSQFINFPIYLWTSKKVTEEEPVEDAEAESEKPEDKEKSEKDDESVEDVTEEKEDKSKTKKVEKTVWDWELLNDNKPIWTKKPGEVEDKEYEEFYKALTKDHSEPLAKTHFVAEGEVSFKSVLFIPKVQPSESFNKYGTLSDNIKLYVRRVFITDEFSDLLPKYLNFIKGIVDSDDLPLNVSRETLQQHKLLKIIKKKLIRKALDMMKKLDAEVYKKFWNEYSTNIKLGMFEDPANRMRLAKLLLFQSSADANELVSLSDYVSRMKPKQEHIYYIAGASRSEVEKSPFVEKLLRRGYEVLYLTEAVDEYSISSLPDFEGKKFQNVAKDGFTLPTNKEKSEELKKEYEPLTKWLDDILKDKVQKTVISERLTESPSALVASMFGWTGNMERLALANAHQKKEDAQRDFYLKQKKIFEINPRHPIIKDLLKRVKDDADDSKAKEIALMMFRTASLRSGYMVQDSLEFAQSVESMMRQTLGISESEKVEDFDDDDYEDDQSPEQKSSAEQTEDIAAEADEEREHDEL